MQIIKQVIAALLIITGAAHAADIHAHFAFGTVDKDGNHVGLQFPSDGKYHEFPDYVAKETIYVKQIYIFFAGGSAIAHGFSGHLYKETQIQFVNGVEGDPLYYFAWAMPQTPLEGPQIKINYGNDALKLDAGDHLGLSVVSYPLDPASSASCQGWFLYTLTP